FVNENIFSGLSVDAGHRQNLHELIVGAQGVARNQQLQGFVDRIEQHNQALRTYSGALPAPEMGGMKADAFCALAPRPSIDAEIQDAERMLAAARAQAPIGTGRLFEALELAPLDIAEIQRLLARDLQGLDTAAAALVQEHLSRLPRGSEAWVAEGMRRVPADCRECPFCAQDMTNSPVLTHYRAFFSGEYRNLKESISRLSASIEQTQADHGPAAFERALRVATERRAFWSRFADIPEIAFDSGTLDQDWRRAQRLVAAAIASKAAAPLERMTLPQETLDAIAAYQAHVDRAARLSGEL